MSTSPLTLRERLSRRARQRGIALVMTLALLVLITLAVLVFFIRIAANRDIENGSTAHVEAEILARSSLNAITSELQHEMVVNSTTTGSDTNSPPQYYVLRPAKPQDAMPQRVLTSAVAAVTPTTDNKFNNLVKQSVSTAFAFTPSATSVIKAVAARTDTPSLDGRIVGLTRWNLPDLIGDSTAVSGFDNVSELPEWVMMTRNGIGSGVTIAQAKDKSPTNGSYVVGRFAYNIYDEGGLVDINATGYPSTSGTGDNLQILKGTRAGIDLSQIPGIDSTANADSLISWRNAASKTGFSPASANSLDWYVNFALQFGFPKGFLKPWSTTSGASADQRFISRQDLIRYATSGQAGIATKALPYLTTFSRDLDQPSPAPDSARPRIVSNTSTDSYAGNDASGHDDDFNPAFLSIRATSAFNRNDGSKAVIGEPLVKKRFALNRLAWLTYQGPSANRTLTDADMQTVVNAGITPAFLQQGTDANILLYFGLTWDSTNHYWTYNHSITGSVGQPIVGYLSKVRDAGREPDFFELLKATINAGALAKGATAPAGQLEESSEYTYDTKLDYAILQIGANIIDQFDADGYPTRLRFYDGSVTTEFRGNENLPYFYRVHSGTIISSLPSPFPTATSVSWTSSANLTDSGFYSVLWQPEIWNPYDVNSSRGNPRPTNFRIVADNAPLDADGNSLTGTYNTNQSLTEAVAPSRIYSTSMDTAKTPSSYITANLSSTLTWKGDNTALTFTDNSGALFREPTLLTKPNLPAGSNLALGPNNLMISLFQDSRLLSYWDSTNGALKCLNDTKTATAASTAVAYIGFYFGMGPLSWVNTAGGTSSVLTMTENDGQTSSTSGSTAVTYRVQYSDSASTWITYDQKYAPNLRSVQGMNISGSGLVAFPSFSISPWVGSVDPRTRRFGNPGGSGRGDLYASKIPTWIDSANMMMPSDRPDTSSGFGWWSHFDTTNVTRSTLGMAEAGGWYPSPATTWMPSTPSTPALHYRPGMVSQNNPTAVCNNFTGQTSDTALTAQYYADADGVVRRGMAAFVPTNGATAPAASLVGLPMAKTVNAGVTVANQSQSRPVVLNRPFRSVAELGYVFSDTPWKNLSVSTPESGYSALLDVFCLQEPERTDALVAGRINLNTRQKAVLQAALSGAAKDVLAPGSSGLTSTEATSLASLLPTRTQSTSTTGGPGPLRNLGDLVGRWVQSTSASQGGTDGAQSYDGFSADIGTVFSSNATLNNIQRFREAPIRALADVGTTRTWNLLIDVIVQTGRYPASASTFDQFSVAGEQHYWLHLALDRATGQVIDQQLENVQE